MSYTNDNFPLIVKDLHDLLEKHISKMPNEVTFYEMIKYLGYTAFMFGSLHGALINRIAIERDLPPYEGNLGEMYTSGFMAGLSCTTG